MKTVQKLGGQVLLESLPRGEALAQWIEKQVREKGGRIDRSGLDALLATSISDARILDQNLEKLVAYAGGERIGSPAVRALVAESREASVFELVDAVGQRDRHAALAAYRSLLAEDVSPIYILVMLTRQIRAAPAGARGAGAAGRPGDDVEAASEGCHEDRPAVAPFFDRPLYRSVRQAGGDRSGDQDRPGNRRSRRRTASGRVNELTS